MNPRPLRNLFDVSMYHVLFKISIKSTGLFVLVGAEYDVLRSVCLAMDDYTLSVHITMGFVCMLRLALVC